MFYSAAMAAQHWRPFATLLILFLALHAAFSADPPVPAPEIGADSNYPISYPPLNSPAPEISAASNFPISYPPLNSPEISSSPAISPLTETSGSPSPSPAPETSLPQSSSPSPSPSAMLAPLADSDADADADADSDADTAFQDAFPSNRTSVYAVTAPTVDGGMSGGKKAGVVFGVMIGGGVVVLAGIVCKKRRENIRRSRYGYATRRGLI